MKFELTREDLAIFQLLVADYAQLVGTMVHNTQGEAQESASKQLQWALGWVSKLEGLSDER